VCFLSVLLSALTAEAQVPVSVTVEVQVTDEQGTPLPGARIRIGETTTGVTDDRGIYKAQIQVVPGSYEIAVQRGGFERSRKTLQVPPQPTEATLTVSFRLRALLDSVPPPISLPKDRPPIPADRNYAIVKIFYATDRAVTGAVEPARFFGTDRAMQLPGSLAYGTCDVSIPRDHRLGELEAPSIWRLEFREDPAKHVVLLKVVPEEASGFFSQLSARIGQSAEKEAFVFIHGYNVTFEDAARRTGQMAYDLAFDGAPILYSWPSQGSTLKYPVDETNVEWTTSHLKEFLQKIAADVQAKKVHLIAHSMGNRALTRALKDIAAEQGATALPRFRQVVLAAPDIDADVFKQLAEQMTRTSERVTLYASSNDEALVASKKIHGYPRAGDSGQGLVIVPGVDTLDVSAIDTSLLGHSYYGENKSVLADLFNLLRKGEGPDKRLGLLLKQTPAGRYWVFNP
jgi:esterase/lipase superfamily enzyme